MFGRRSRPRRLIRAPERRRSSSVTPSSRSSLLTASLSAGCEMCIRSLARRSEPCWVTAAMYSSCSIRTRVLLWRFDDRPRLARLHRKCWQRGGVAA